ncbi:glycoside hydrolase [Pedobacter sp. AW1-32]|uniref:glycoside hydrolase n=1 Tax=Pedobacter sp. AW1-32 TaxID=3383026 RepID=UPI003FEE53CD
MNTFSRALKVLVLLSFCSATALNAQESQTVKVTIDLKNPMQTIEGFGASDAWTCQFAGLWPDAKRNKMADLLFSKKLDKDGKPIGIGLNFWRFSIGGGSSEQGKESGIKSEWRRQQSFLKLNGQYDERAMPGQMWFFNAAKSRGVKHFLGFVNSPHVNFTLNNKAFSSDGKGNLDFSKVQGFSNDLAKTIQIIKNKSGVELEYLSPINEPQWKWNEGNQEGCPYDNEQISALVKNLSQTLKTQNLKTKIQIAEAGQLDYLSTHKDSSKSQQVSYFFNPTSAGYIGNLSNVDHSISGHSYFTTSPEARAINIRQSVASEVSKVKDLRFWMSEYCVLGDSLLQGGGRDLGMVTALFIAKLIHHDITYANATSWQWWLAISSGDYKDGLVYIDDNQKDGEVYESKLLWAFGNYSRFIPEGSKRLKVNAVNDQDLYVSSYVHKKKIITVVVNYRKTKANFVLEGLEAVKNQVQLYTTSATASLTPSVAKLSELILPEESVTTIIADLN